MSNPQPQVNARASNALLAEFTEHARRAPRSLAIRSRGSEVSYAGLAAAAASYAGGLSQLGIGADDIVGFAATRNAETIALMLAISAVGAAYLPLDPTLSDDRLAAMVDDANPRLVIVDEVLRSKLPTEPSRGQRLVSDRGALISPGIELELQPSGELAYVLFTSGSTGRPKGVAMRTAAVAELLAWHRQHPRLGQPKRTLQFAPLGFDVSFQEIFSTLAAGGSLILPSDAERRDPWMLLDLLRSERVQRLFVPYVALQALADAARSEGAAQANLLEDVVTAGEQLRITPAVREWFAALPGCVLHNQYGPTETHVVTAHELDGDPAQWPELPPIGIALPHVRTRIQAAFEDQSAEEGELMLGGACLAAGYIGRPDLTELQFVESGGARWYRTGDRVRHAGGVLEYLGRLDDQIKIAGNRVEPGEVEAVLCRHTEVAQAIVVAHNGELNGPSRLVAHIVPRQFGVPETALAKSLARHCGSVLPEYMQPQAFVLHAVLPATASGKVDRRALAANGDDTPVRWLDRAPLRAQLLDLWQRLLGDDRLDAAANLFDAGARSLTVVHALNEMRRHGLMLSVAQIYENPSVEAQADLLESTRAGHRSMYGERQRGTRQRAAFARFSNRHGRG